MAYSVTSVITWPARQAIGFFVNVYQAIAGLTLEDILPPWVRNTLEWLKKQVPLAIGYGTPPQQVTASVVIAIAMVVGSFTLLTWLALVMLIPLTIGIWRFVPVVDEYWPLNDGGRA